MDVVHVADAVQRCPLIAINRFPDVHLPHREPLILLHPDLLWCTACSDGPKWMPATGGLFSTSSIALMVAASGCRGEADSPPVSRRPAGLLLFSCQTWWLEEKETTASLGEATTGRLKPCCSPFNNYSAKWIVGNSPHYSRSLRWMIVLLYTTHIHSKNYQDNTFFRDLFVFISGLFVFISVTRRPSSDILCWKQYPEFEISVMGYCSISRDSEPIKLRHVWRFTYSIY